MTQPQDKMRAEFEAWAKDRGYQRDELDRSTISLVSPDYFNLHTEESWQAWQAACAQQSAQPQQDALDAARFRQTIRHVGGQRNTSCQTFGLVTLKPVSGNIMQGSVAEHFVKAIDSAIKEGNHGC